MVIASLAGAPLLRNEEDDISRLADLFHVSFQYYSTQLSPLTSDFIRDIRTIAGLGFTACLAAETYAVCYQSYLDCFIQHGRGDFRQHRGALFLLSQTLANMVILAIDSFSTLPNCNYYLSFVEVVKKTIDNVRTNMAGKKAEAKLMLKLLEYPDVSISR